MSSLVHFRGGFFVVARHYQQLKMKIAFPATEDRS